MEKAIEPESVEVRAPEFPAMRGMAPIRKPAPEPHFAPMRAMAVASTAPEILPAVASSGGVLTAASAGRHFAVGKTPGVAIALSFIFPGGGQFYNGDTKKGFAVFALAILASCITLYVGIPLLGAPLSLGLWVWSFLDAGKVARQQKALW
jgi:TM2 domain-containing membrane protein YozV